MLARSLVTLALATGSLAAFALGCSGNVQEQDDAATLESALEAENGGLDTAPERPEFADPVIRAISKFEPRLADVQDMTTAVAREGARSYTVAVFWGHLPTARDAEPTEVEPAPIEWSGAVSVDDGAIGVKRTLKFEREDGLAPREDRRIVAFKSRTLPHVDGMLLRVVVPAGGSQTLHFKSAALSTDIDLTRVALQGGGAERLADGRNGLAYIGFADVPGCSRGFLFGRWNKVRARLGTFRGHVVDAGGDAVGSIRGIWGHAPRKDRDLFFGKYISTDGDHRGLLGGVYGDGAFKGIWGVRDPNAAGVLEGVYSDGYLKDDGRGVMLGRWSERCDAR